ncbi:MAG TPA: hypothetical protein VGN17_28365 [Bryobacteraceae bacterium]|jgi:hypothetical protein
MVNCSHSMGFFCQTDSVLVHGDSKVIPEKRHIDRLVTIIKRLQKVLRQDPSGTPYGAIIIFDAN